MDVTPRNLEFLNGIHAYVQDTGWQPTVRELGVRMGVSSPSTTHEHLARLREAGLVERNGSRLRITTLGLSALLARSLAA